MTETLYQELNDADPITSTATTGELELRFPKLRQVTRVSPLLKRCHRVDQVLVTRVMEACFHGMTTREVDDLVKALGAETRASKSQVSRIGTNTNQSVATFRNGALADQAHPHVFLDATYC